MREHPERKIVVEGFTDDRGSKAANQRLSERRAQAVKDYLVKKAVDPAIWQTATKCRTQAASGAACANLGRESRRNAALVKCLQRDRRVEVMAPREP